MKATVRWEGDAKFRATAAGSGAGILMDHLHGVAARRQRSGKPLQIGGDTAVASPVVIEECDPHQAGRSGTAQNRRCRT